LVDIEIGSSPASWSDPVAAEVVARSLFDAFLPSAEIAPKSLLCIGGVHFEPSFCAAALANDSVMPLAISHVLPNQWLRGYESQDGERRLKACIDSVRGGVDAIAFHNSISGPLKTQLKSFGESIGVPTFVHRKLRSTAELGLVFRGMGA